jgi:hypothetical protein
VPGSLKLSQDPELLGLTLPPVRTCGFQICHCEGQDGALQDNRNQNTVAFATLPSSCSQPQPRGILVAPGLCSPFLYSCKYITTVCKEKGDEIGYTLILFKSYEISKKWLELLFWNLSWPEHATDLVQLVDRCWGSSLAFRGRPISRPSTQSIGCAQEQSQCRQKGHWPFPRRLAIPSEKALWTCSEPLFAYKFA